MTGKVLLGILLSFSLLLASCYPELSVQQYDKLKKDIAELDTQRQILEEETVALRAKHTEIRAYADFLNRMIATQNSENIVSGKAQFDADSLVAAKGELTKMAESLGDPDIIYYLDLITPKGTQNVAAYNKIIEYCLKGIRENLE
jgi:hypothetical protein